MGEFLAELGMELVGELVEGSIGLFLRSRKVKRWVKTLVMAILAALPVAILGGVAFSVGHRGGSLLLTGFLWLLAAAVAIVFFGVVLRGHRRNWAPKEKKQRIGRKTYEP